MSNKKTIKIIDFDPSFTLGFVESREEIGESPVSHYFMQLDDLSINIKICYKWVKWGEFFMKEISKELKNSFFEKSKNQIFVKCIQSAPEFDIKEKNHILTIDDTLLNINEDAQESILNEWSVVLYNGLWNENTTITFKLKINLKEFLLLAHWHIPSLDKSYPYTKQV